MAVRTPSTVLIVLRHVPQLLQFARQRVRRLPDDAPVEEQASASGGGLMPAPIAVHGLDPRLAELDHPVGDARQASAQAVARAPPRGCLEVALSRSDRRLARLHRVFVARARMDLRRHQRADLAVGRSRLARQSAQPEARR